MEKLLANFIGVLSLDEMLLEKVNDLPRDTFTKEGLATILILKSKLSDKDDLKSFYDDNVNEEMYQPNEIQKAYIQCLYHACINENMEIIEYLLSDAFKSHDIDRDENPLLVKICLAEKKESVKKLLSDERIFKELHSGLRLITWKTKPSVTDIRSIGSFVYHSSMSRDDVANELIKQVNSLHLNVQMTATKCKKHWKYCNEAYENPFTQFHK